MNQLIIDLYNINAIKFGQFKLKTGIISPIYIDLRVTISYPHILEEVANQMWTKAEKLEFDILAGVPYTAIPITTAISIKHGIPMVMRRKEVKDYGTKKAIEGAFQPGQRCLIIEDLVTSGSSVFETIKPLEREELIVKDIIVLLNRQQGARENIKEKGYDLHAIMTITEMLTALSEAEKITDEVHTETLTFIKENQVKK